MRRHRENPANVAGVEIDVSIRYFIQQEYQFEQYLSEQPTDGRFKL